MDEEDTKPKFIMDDGPDFNKYALYIIKEDGYKLFYKPSKLDGGDGEYWAIKDGRSYKSKDPLKLLSMIIIWEELGDKPDEMKIDEWIDDSIKENAHPEDDFILHSNEEFKQMVEDYKEFFQILGIEFPKDISREDFAKLLETYYKV